VTFFLRFFSFNFFNCPYIRIFSAFFWLWDRSIDDKRMGLTTYTNFYGKQGCGFAVLGSAAWAKLGQWQRDTPDISLMWET
jgi:hypothetical protein